MLFSLSGPRLDLTLDKSQQSIALQVITQGKYSENDIVYIRISGDLSEGFALTKDSLCFYGKPENTIIYYDSITDLRKSYDRGEDLPTSLEISYDNNKILYLHPLSTSDLFMPECLCNYLSVVKNMIVK